MKTARLCVEPECGLVTSRGYEWKGQWYCDRHYEAVFSRDTHFVSDGQYFMKKEGTSICMGNDRHHKGVSVDMDK